MADTTQASNSIGASYGKTETLWQVFAVNKKRDRGYTKFFNTEQGALGELAGAADEWVDIHYEKREWQVYDD